jgi:hypothetical protein
VRTLTVLPSPTEGAVPNKKPEEEGVAAITAQNSDQAAVRLTCTGTATCGGKLTLTARGRTGKGKKKLSKAETIGAATFSIPAGKTATIKPTLDGAGRALLSTAHGRLGATLTVLKSSPAPSQTRTEKVQLVLQRAANAKRPKR